ncbi:MAG: hypothetical protein ACRBBP_04890 [Bdellovibrionales bacterium]
MFKLVVFFLFFLNLQLAEAQKVSFYEVKETNTQTFSFDLYTHLDCKITEVETLICAYIIGEGDFSEADFDLMVTYDRTKYENGEGTPVRDLLILENIIVIQFKFTEDAKNTEEEQLDSAVEQVEASLKKAPHKLTLTYYGEGFDKTAMSNPVKSESL